MEYEDDQLFRSLAEAGISGEVLTPHPRGDGKVPRRVIYTAILEGSDILNAPLYSEKSCDYICFTDNTKLRSDFWRIVRITPASETNRYMLAKAIKVLGADILCAYDESLWMDGSILLKRDPWNLIDGQFSDSSFAFMKHPNRSCIFEEIEACAVQGKDSRSNLDAVRLRLIDAGYPKNNGLISGGFIYRRHLDEVKQLFREWMRNIGQFSRRDQLTFNYTCWQKGQSVTYIDVDIFNNEYFAVLPHFNTFVGRMKWIRKFLIVSGREKYDRFASRLLRDRGLST